MGTIAEKLAYLNNTKTAIKNAIIDKGVTVEDTDTFREYADKIAEISSGGSIIDRTYIFNGEDTTPAWNTDLVGTGTAFAQNSNSWVWRINGDSVNNGRRLWESDVQSNMQSFVFNKLVQWSSYNTLNIQLSYHTNPSYQYNQFALGAVTTYPTNYNNATPNSNKRIYINHDGSSVNIGKMNRLYSVNVSNWDNSYFSIYKCDGIWELSKIWLESDRVGNREYYLDFEFNDNKDACSDKTMPTTYGTIADGMFTTNTSNVTSITNFYCDNMKTQNFCIEVRCKINSFNGSLVDILEFASGSYTYFWFNIYKNGNYEIGGFMGSSSAVADKSGASGVTTNNEWFTVKVRFIQKPTRKYEIYFNDVLTATQTNSYSFQNFTGMYLNGGATNTSYKGSVSYDYIRMYWES